MRTILMILGIFCTVLGVIGAILPIIPGLPFFILAAFFFSYLAFALVSSDSSTSIIGIFFSA